MQRFPLSRKRPIFKGSEWRSIDGETGFASEMSGRLAERSAREAGRLKVAIYFLRLPTITVPYGVLAERVFPAGSLVLPPHTLSKPTQNI